MINQHLLDYLRKLKLGRSRGSQVSPQRNSNIIPLLQQMFQQQQGGQQRPPQMQMGNQAGQFAGGNQSRQMGTAGLPTQRNVQNKMMGTAMAPNQHMQRLQAYQGGPYGRG
jgi:hypothetical protein